MTIHGKAWLFDHLVGTRDERRRHFQAERLGSLEIDYQLVFRRCLYRQISRLLASEDAVDVSGRSSEHIHWVGAVGHQATDGGEIAERVDCRQTVTGGQRDDQLTMDIGDDVRQNKKPALWLTREGVDDAFEFACVANAGRDHLNVER